MRELLTSLKEFFEGRKVFDDDVEVQTSPYGTKWVSPITVLLDEEMMDRIRKAGPPLEPPQKPLG